MSSASKSLYAAIMLFAALVVIGGKCPSLGRHFIAEGSGGDDVGELYQMSQLDRFREEIPVLRPQPTAGMEEAEVLTLGDSFFNSTLGSQLFATELARRSGLRVCNLQSQTFPEPQTFPLSFLESIGYRGDRRRVLILESVERYALKRSGHYNATAGASQGFLNAVYNKVVDNSDLEYFFKNNVLVYPLAKWLKNFRFAHFRMMDRSIGAYSEHPDMLFYSEDLDFAAQRKNDDMLESAARDIATLSEHLKRRFDLDLIYVIVPNKYSIYHRYVGNGYSYDGFIPRLSKKLTAYGVRNVNLYSLYSRYDKSGPLLYYATDTHYTPLGKRLLVDACLKTLEAARQGD